MSEVNSAVVRDGATGANRHCPVCNQTLAKTLFYPTESPGPVSRCLYCGMVFIQAIEDAHAIIFDGPVLYNSVPQILTSSNLDDVKDSWEFNILPEKEAEAPAIRLNAVTALKRIEMLTGNPQNKLRLLDVGSGFGFFLAAAKERGWKSYGLEPLPASSIYARAKFGLEITTDTLRENTFPENYFDVITAFQVFEHLPDPQGYIHLLSRFLKEQGLFFFEMPVFDTWSIRLLGPRHRHFVQDHLNFFTSETIRVLLNNLGFKVVDSFRPARIMSVRHLLTQWIASRLPKRFAQGMLNLVQRTGLWERTISINMGDMLSVIAKKI